MATFGGKDMVSVYVVSLYDLAAKASKNQGL